MVAYQYYIKIIHPQFDWYSEVSSHVIHNVIDDLDNTFKYFLDKSKPSKKAATAGQELSDYLTSHFDMCD